MEILSLTGDVGGTCALCDKKKGPVFYIILIDNKLKDLYQNLASNNARN